MAHLLKRIVSHFGVLGFIACCVLGARAVNHLIDARYLNDSAEPVRTVEKVDRRARDGTDTDRTGALASKADRESAKDGTAVAARNMFCATCEPEQTPPNPGPPPTDLDGVPISDLPLELLATNLARPSTDSFATIRNRDSGQQGSFYTGQPMPGAGPIERIDGASVVFLNPHSGRRERISLFAARPAAGRNRPKTGPRPASGRKRPVNPYAESIIKIDDTTYEVERSLVDNLITNPQKLGARVRPLTQDGGSVAFKVYSVRSTSPLAAIGIRNGDSIEAINGYKMTTNPDKLLEMYTKLQTEQSLSVSVRRRGQLLAMDYRVR